MFMQRPFISCARSPPFSQASWCCATFGYEPRIVPATRGRRHADLQLAVVGYGFPELFVLDVKRPFLRRRPMMRRCACERAILFTVPRCSPSWKFAMPSRAMSYRDIASPHGDGAAGRAPR